MAVRRELEASQRPDKAELLSLTPKFGKGAERLAVRCLELNVSMMFLTFRRNSRVAVVSASWHFSISSSTRLLNTS